MTPPLYILFDPVFDSPARGEQEVKDEAFDMAQELSELSGYDIMSDDFVESYKNIEGILMRANEHRSHLYFLALHTLKHMLTDGSIHLAHPEDDEDLDLLEFARDAIDNAADAIVDMLTQIVFFKKEGSSVVSNDKFENLPDDLRKVLFTFMPEEEV